MLNPPDPSGTLRKSTESRGVGPAPLGLGPLMSNASQTRNPMERVILGEISGAHGVDGDVRVRVSMDSVDPFFELDSVWLGRTASDPEARRYGVEGCANARPGEVRLRLEGVAGRDSVGKLIGLVVLAPASALPPLPEGEFYWYELIGFSVESAAGESVGTVREIWETGAHDVLVVQDEEGVRRLIPTADELMEAIDANGRRIVVADLPGLLDPS